MTRHSDRPGCTASEYESKIDENDVELRWEFTLDEGRLVPTAVILAMKKDLVVSSVQPKEVGNSYGWAYWKNTQYSDRRKEFAAGISVSYGLAGLAFLASKLSWLMVICQWSL